MAMAGAVLPRSLRIAIPNEAILVVLNRQIISHFDTAIFEAKQQSPRHCSHGCALHIDQEEADEQAVGRARMRSTGRGPPS